MILLWLVLASRAGDAEDAARELLRHNEAAAVLASDVAAARASGAGRSEVARLMALYRAEAEALAAIETPIVQARADAEEQIRRVALRALRDAVAAGSKDDRAREVVGAWLGEPMTRLGALDQALDQCRTTGDGGLREALALDIADQAQVVNALATYDGATFRADAARADAQAKTLRAQSAPGRAGALEAVVEAERLEREAAFLRDREAESTELADRARTLAATAQVVAREIP